MRKLQSEGKNAGTGNGSMPSDLVAKQNYQDVVNDGKVKGMGYGRKKGKRRRLEAEGVELFP